LYYGFVLLRTLQVLGAYGYRGFFEQKPHFVESAAYALDNARWLLEHTELPVPLPELTANLRKILDRDTRTEPGTGLTVDISSFSYLKYGYPKDHSGHGGGFVFDCRGLPNPGRHPEYRHITGRDAPVIGFLEKEQAVSDFLEYVRRIVGLTVDNYLVRGFDHLSVNFGCTGGQHRSVYCAEQLYRYLRDHYRIRVNLSHKMLD
jgi:RNase adaptor protein for sRNA GlmZ degradation